jgi:iron complex transport system substrate-binding protein
MKPSGRMAIVALILVGAGAAWLLHRLQPAAGDGQPGSGPVRRIICAAPSVTEMVFALGQGDRVVGVTDYCTYPPEALKTKPRIGGLYDPNRERILKLQPDLIVYVGNFDALTTFADEHGIRTLSIQMGTLEGIRRALRTLGRRLDCPREAERLIGRFDAELGKVRARVHMQPRKRVYLCTAHKPADLGKLGTCSPEGFLGELLAIAGGENIFADVQGAWPQISKESLLKRAPDVIVELHPRGMGADPSTFDRLRQDWQKLESIPAVRRGEIHFLTEDFLLIPSVRAPRIARRLAQVIHPEAFRDARD